MKKLAVLALLGGLYAASVAPVSGQSVSTVQQLDIYLNHVAQVELDKRAADVSAIQSRQEAEARKARFRETVLRLIGGLPDERGSVHVRSVGTVQEQGFHVERLVYDSLPGFHVPANLYLPDSGHAPYPAVIYTPGHSPSGKLEAWLFASNLARQGIAVLAYDPISEGERLQYFDPSSKTSLAGRPTGEHSEASAQIMLTGEHIARYFVWDAMRGLDYLSSRPDIDSQRLGAFGCSGGGTVTAYLAALDPRVKAAGVGCYITSFHHLLGSIGPQEGEQTIPGFIKDGFDFPDWIEAAAPTPYAVISTTEDMFPFEGARQSVQEAKRIYALYGAADRLAWITGPGRHGNLRPIYPEIMRFFLHWLKGSDELPKVEPIPPPPPQSLLCTSTGQVSTSLQGETLYSLNRKVADGLERNPNHRRTKSQARQLRDRLAGDVAALSGIDQGSALPPQKFTVLDSKQRTGYVLEEIAFASVTGIELHGFLAVPNRGGKKPAFLLLKVRGDSETFKDGSAFDRLAQSGQVVFAPQLLPGSADDQEQKSALLGPFYLTSLRAFLVGKTIAGLRTEDALRCAQWLASRGGAKPSVIEVQGEGAMGMVALQLAILDSHVRAVTLDRSLLLYRSAADAPAPRELAQTAIPGVLRRYDLDDFMAGIWPRRVTLQDPIDGAGNAIGQAEAKQLLSGLLNFDRDLHTNDRVKLEISPVVSNVAIDANTGRQ